MMAILIEFTVLFTTIKKRGTDKQLIRKGNNWGPSSWFGTTVPTALMIAFNRIGRWDEAKKKSFMLVVLMTKDALVSSIHSPGGLISGSLRKKANRKNENKVTI